MKVNIKAILTVISFIFGISFIRLLKKQKQTSDKLQEVKKQNDKNLSEYKDYKKTAEKLFKLEREIINNLEKKAFNYDLLKEKYDYLLKENRDKYKQEQKEFLKQKPFLKITLNRAKRTNTSKYYGVSKNKNDTYQTTINVNNKAIYLGTYQTEEDAAKAYNDYILKNKLSNKRLNNLSLNYDIPKTTKEKKDIEKDIKYENFKYLLNNLFKDKNIIKLSDFKSLCIKYLGLSLHDIDKYRKLAFKELFIKTSYINTEKFIYLNNDDFETFKKALKPEQLSIIEQKNLNPDFEKIAKEFNTPYLNANIIKTWYTSPKPPQKFKGVTKIGKDGFKAILVSQGKAYYKFAKTEELAAAEYNALVREHRKGYGYLNKIE